MANRMLDNTLRSLPLLSRMKRIKIVLVILILVAPYQENLHAQNWQWVQRSGTGSIDNGIDICSDPFGNAYLLTRHELIKYNPGGTQMWTYSFPYSLPASSCCFAWNKIYVLLDSGAGSVVKPLDIFGNIYPNVIFNTSKGKDITTDGSGHLIMALTQPSAIKKIDTSGTLSWVGPSSANFNAVACDDSGYVYATGDFSGTVMFNSYVLNATGASDIFIIKINPFFGQTVWATSAGGSSPLYNNSRDAGNGICIDANRNVYVTGSYVDSALFETQAVVSSFPTGNEMFAARYDNTGNLSWVISGGGWFDQEGRCIVVDGEDNLLIGGSFVPEMYLPSQQINGWGNYDAFIIKCDTNGNYISSLVAGGPGWNEYVFGLTVNPLGNIYACGSLSDTAYFDSDTIVSAGSFDAFIARIDFLSGIIEPSENSNAVVYPNPCGLDQIHFGFNVSGLRTIEIYDGTGKLLSVTSSKEMNVSISMAELPQGIYLYHVRRGNLLESVGKFVRL